MKTYLFPGGVKMISLGIITKDVFCCWCFYLRGSCKIKKMSLNVRETFFLSVF